MWIFPCDVNIMFLPFFRCISSCCLEWQTWIWSRQRRTGCSCVTTFSVSQSWCVILTCLTMYSHWVVFALNYSTSQGQCKGVQQDYHRVEVTSIVLWMISVTWWSCLNFLFFFLGTINSGCPFQMRRREEEFTFYGLITLKLSSGRNLIQYKPQPA